MGSKQSIVIAVMWFFQNTKTIGIFADLPRPVNSVSYLISMRLEILLLPSPSYG
jgi:hypothetical protein